MYMKQRAFAIITLALLCGWAGSRLQFYMEKTLPDGCFQAHRQLFVALIASTVCLATIVLGGSVELLFQRRQRRGKGSARRGT